MKNAELRKLLLQYPDDYEVEIWDEDCGDFVEIINVDTDIKTKKIELTSYEIGRAHV